MLRSFARGALVISPVYRNGRPVPGLSAPFVLKSAAAASLCLCSIPLSRPVCLPCLFFQKISRLSDSATRYRTTGRSVYIRQMHEDQHRADTSQLPSDVKKFKQSYFRFPLSPPSSGTVTALSSPRLATLDPDSADVADKLLLSNQGFRSGRPPSQTSTDENAADSDGYATERSSLTSKRPPHKATNRALTLPSSSSAFENMILSSPSKSSRLLNRRSSSASSSSSSSTSSPDIIPLPPPTAGKGRKVAASLQLFKETAGPDEPTSSDRANEGSVCSRRQGGTSQPAQVAAAQFEFVKRSDWPDREAAAVRREKSSTALERARTRDSVREDDLRSKERKVSTRDSSVSDLSQRRKEVGTRHEAGRGRQRERPTNEVVLPDLSSTVNTVFHDLPSPFVRSLSRAYPPSPSPSRSPSSRPLSSSFYHSAAESTSRFSPSRSPSAESSAPSRQRVCHSRSLTPIQTSSTSHQTAGIPVSPDASKSFSPWSTDDESNWETASATTSTSTTSLPFPSDDFIHSTNSNEILPSHRRLTNVLGHGNSSDLNYNDLYEKLPHIPLRPFRNQVGGHSAIYKFTRQAVCKVRQSRFFFILFRIELKLYCSLFSCPSPLFRTKISSMKQ